MNHDLNHDDHLDEPALRALAEQLDALGQAERGEPDTGFEGRLASTTRPGVLATVRADRASSWAWWALPVAACAVFAVSAVVLMRPAPTPEGSSVTLASIESDIEDFLFIDALHDENDVTGGLTNSGSDEPTADELLFELLEAEGGAS